MIYSYRYYWYALCATIFLESLLYICSYWYANNFILLVIARLLIIGTLFFAIYRYIITIKQELFYRNLVLDTSNLQFALVNQQTKQFIFSNFKEDKRFIEWNKLLDLDSIMDINAVKVKEYSTADRLYQAYVQSLHFPSLDLRLWFWVVSDITDTAKKEKEWSLLLHRYREVSFQAEMLLNNLTIPIWQIRKGDVIYKNYALQQMMKRYGKKEIQSVLERLTNNKHIDKIYIKDSVLSNWRFYNFSTETDDVFTGCAIDITELKDVEHKLQWHKECLHKIMEYTSFNAILLLDENLVLKYCNDLFVTLFNLRKDFLNTKPHIAAILDAMQEQGKLPETVDYQAFKQEKLKQISAMEEVHDYFYLKSGQVIKYTFMPIDSNATLLIYHDFSERLKVEQMQTMMEQSMQLVIDNNAMPIALIKMNGVINVLNKPMQKLCGEVQSLEHLLTNLQLNSEMKAELHLAINRGLMGHHIEMLNNMQITVLPGYGVMICFMA